MLSYDIGEHYTRVYTAPTSQHLKVLPLIPDERQYVITTDSLEEHTECGQKRKYKCRVCGKGFSQAQNVGIHMRQHTGDKPYSCDVCGDKFTVLCNMKRHRAKNHSWFTDPVTTSSSDASIDLSASNILLNAVSSIDIKSQNDHVDLGHLVHKCYICSEMFNTVTDLAEHSKAQHNLLDLTQLSHNLVNHMVKPVRRRSMDYNVSSSFPSVPATTPSTTLPPVVASVPEYMPSYPCEYCDKTFTVRSNFQYHMRECHPEKCQLTNEKLTAIEKKQQAYAAIERKRLEEIASLEHKHNELITMEAKSAADPQHMSIHQIHSSISMSEDLTYSCPVCFQMCKGCNNFLSHLHQHDSVSKPHVIDPTCIKEIPEVVANKSLPKVTTPTKRPNNTLGMNVLPKIEDAGQNGYKCDQCTMVFSNRFSLRTHKRTHPITEDSTSTTYPCTSCKRTFATSFHLKAHMKTHMVDRPFVCPHCNKGLKDANGLVAHVKIHGVNISKHEASLMKLLQVPQNSVYFCHSCNQEFTQADELVTHVKGHGLDITKQHTEAMKRASVKSGVPQLDTALRNIKQEGVREHRSSSALLQKCAKEAVSDQPSDMTQATLQAQYPLLNTAETQQVRYCMTVLFLALYCKLLYRVHIKVVC